MSDDMPSHASGASTLARHLEDLSLEASSPLMRTVAHEINAIELALSRGVTYKQIAAAIGADGHPPKLKTLRECVYRVRKRRALAGAAMASTNSPPQSMAPASATPVQAQALQLASLSTVQPPHSQALAAKTWPAAPAAAQVPSGLFTSPATDPEVITRIRSTNPDLDMLTWRFQQAQRKASKAKAPDHTTNPTGDTTP